MSKLPEIAMAHREHLLVIKSTTDGERLRERIREERGDARRHAREISPNLKGLSKKSIGP